MEPFLCPVQTAPMSKQSEFHYTYCVSHSISLYLYAPYPSPYFFLSLHLCLAVHLLVFSVFVCLSLRFPPPPPPQVSACMSIHLSFSLHPSCCVPIYFIFFSDPISLFLTALPLPLSLRKAIENLTAWDRRKMISLLESSFIEW